MLISRNISSINRIELSFNKREKNDYLNRIEEMMNGKGWKKFVENICKWENTCINRVPCDVTPLPGIDQINPGPCECLLFARAISEWRAPIIAIHPAIRFIRPYANRERREWSRASNPIKHLCRFENLSVTNATRCFRFDRWNESHFSFFFFPSLSLLLFLQGTFSKEGFDGREREREEKRRSYMKAAL